MSKMIDDKEITKRILYSEDITLLNYLDENLNIGGDDYKNRSRNVNAIKNLENDIKSIGIARMDRIVSGYELFNQIAVVSSIGVTVFTIFLDFIFTFDGLKMIVGGYLTMILILILKTGKSMLEHKKKVHSAIYFKSLLNELK